MLDFIVNQPDGLGPCTTVECLLRASVEASRTYILEEVIYKAQHGGEEGYYDEHGDYHEGHYDDGTYHEDNMNGMPCEEMCFNDMENMRFTDKQAGEMYLEDCVGQCYMDHEGMHHNEEGGWEQDEKNAWGGDEEKNAWGGEEEKNAWGNQEKETGTWGGEDKDAAGESKWGNEEDAFTFRSEDAKRTQIDWALLKGEIGDLMTTADWDKEEAYSFLKDQLVKGLVNQGDGNAEQRIESLMANFEDLDREGFLAML